MGSIKVLNSSGHTETPVRPDDAESVEVGRLLFDAERARGRTLIRTDEDAEGEVAKKFDPEGDYVSIPRIAGG